ncbi:MAG: glycoside hydrolase family 3 N-terminal domain-containing protein [Saprospiraceae bacterium]|nr:glycoside hydrolase family 3 N-terminal domain-containing protein [Saprospiraceae bacterium]
MTRTIYILSVLLVFFLATAFQENQSPKLEDNSEKAQEWVDSIFNEMSLDEKIGQLFWIRAHSNLGQDHIRGVEKAITDFHVGGLTFFQGTPTKQAELTNKYQSLTKRVPLMISIDGEWGLGMRLKDHTISYPRQLMLGAIQDNRLIYEMGKAVANDCKRLGIHVNFAPVVDVNNNAKNPVINTRSFGEDRYNVAAKGYMYMKGMQDNGVIACAKHFPGHGDTDVDSHHDLPIISHDINRLDSIELFPFQVLIDQGVGSIMVAHLHVPEIDDTPNMPTTLSKNAITKLLKNKMNYDGLIMTDALEMEGVAKHHKQGEVEAKALVAGNDLLLLPGDLGNARRTIKEFMNSGKLDSLQVFESVKKALRWKYNVGLTHFDPIKLDNLDEDLNSNQSKVLKRKLIENALTLVRNDNQLIPFEGLEDFDLASLSIGSKTKTTFQNTLSKYKKIAHFNTGKEISASKKKDLLTVFENKDAVIISLHDMSAYASRKFGLTESSKKFIHEIQKVTDVILVVFGNPYSLKDFDEIKCVLNAYDEDEMTEDLAAQALFGVFGIRGRLPITASEKSVYGQGIMTKKLFRLGYGLPEEVGLNSDSLNKIDELAMKVVDSLAAPGCVVLVAKEGKVIYNKAFGYHTTSRKRKMKTTDIFDLASVTKVCATTISTMKLYDEDKIDIDATLGEYLPGIDTTNKNDLVLEDMFRHRARLNSWIPFYTETVTRRKYPMTSIYKKSESDDFSIPVADNLFMKDAWIDSIWFKINRSNLSSTVRYKYSDLGMILMGKTINEVCAKPVNEFAHECFYSPLCLQTTCYKPLEKFSKSNIVPSEEDRYFRRQKLHGHVHDMAAAMMGGVAGHAGLFSNSNDLAIIFQMLLNKGYYGGEQFIESQTVEQFTKRCSECTRRGIGFDMKELNPNKSQNMCPEASENTFGHLGFTGTVVWADPDHELIYIFLSNRTYPSMNNYKLNKMDLRPRIQSAIYNALEN